METAQQTVITLTQLWSMVAEYISYLQTHNRTSEIEDFFDAIHRHEDDHDLALKPMLEFMSKHGMPEEFPEDGSHFNYSHLEACPIRETSTFEANLIAESVFW